MYYWKCFSTFYPGVSQILKISTSMKIKLVLSGKGLNFFIYLKHTHHHKIDTEIQLRKTRRERKKKLWRDKKILDHMFYLKKSKLMTLSSEFPNCYKLFYYLLWFPQNTTCIERLFFKMKLIKILLRNNLSQGTLENLLFIATEAWEAFSLQTLR